MRKIHLDTDIGGDIDDLCALAMLLKWPDVEITGITTAAEENGRRAGYARYVLELADREGVPVAAGADVSLGCYRLMPGYYPEEEMWPEPVAPSPGPIENALELLKQSIAQDAVVVSICPYTNLFLLDQKYPGILSDARVFLMGGSIFPPRPGFPAWGNEMDWNIQLDITSAKQVIENCRPTLVPLPVTVETALRRAYLGPLRDSGPLGELIARQAEAFARFENNEDTIGQRYAEVPEDIINFQHDPLACAVALGWDGVSIEELPLRLEVQDGWLYEWVDSSGKPTRVVTGVNGPRFNEFWLSLVAR